MTYRELFIYILDNGLEDEPVFKDGKIAGFLTVDQAAVMLGVGTETVRVMIFLNQLEHVTIGKEDFIPEYSVRDAAESNKKRIAEIKITKY